MISSSLEVGDGVKCGNNVCSVDLVIDIHHQRLPLPGRILHGRTIDNISRALPYYLLRQIGLGVSDGDGDLIGVM